MKRRRIWALLLVIAMLCSMLPGVAAAQSYSDVQGHWASKAIATWSDRGVIQGWEGKFNPDQNITRGDMAVIIDKIMGYTAKAENNYKDLGQAYYTDAVLKLAGAGVMQGYGNEIRPADAITREEAVAIFARAFGVSAQNSATGFADDAKISSWAKGNVAAFAAHKYVNGRLNNQFVPQGNITRAETVQMLDNMVSDYITSAGTITPKGDRIVIVRAAGVTLKDAAITGSLVLTGSAGEVISDKTKVNGPLVKVGTSTLKETQKPVEPTPGGSGGGGSSSVAAPGAYPLPKGQEKSKSLGVFDYDMTYHVSLTAQNGADIYYEIAEGKDAAEKPTTSSKKFEEYQYRQVEIKQPDAPGKGEPPAEKIYNIKAIAVKNGRSSTVANWNYSVTSNARGVLKTGDALDWNGNKVPGVTLIQDYDSDKMYLVKGRDRAMVVDAGYFDAADPADLYETARKIVGDDTMPIDRNGRHHAACKSAPFLGERNGALLFG